MDSDDRKITQLTQVTSLSDSDLFVVAVSVGTAPVTRAIKKSDAIRGGLTVTAASVTTSNVTGVEGTLHNLDVSGMTANRDFNLPTPSAAGVRCGVRLSVGDATYALLLKINAAEWSRIFITDEIAIFVSTGTGAGDWEVEVDGRIPCKTRVKNTGAQNINTATTTKITLDETDFDVGNCADTGNSQIDVRRTGKYFIAGHYRINSLSAAAPRLSMDVQASGSVIASDERSANISTYPAGNASTVKDLAAGDFLELYAYQDSGATQATLIGSGNNPHMEFFEVLP